MLTHADDTNAGSSPAASVQGEQTRLLYRLPLRLTTNVMNAVLVVAVLWNELSRPLLASWLGLMCAVVAVRLVLCKLFDRQRPDEREMARWARHFMIGAVVTGSLWGATTLVILLTPDIIYHVFVAFVVAGMSAAAAATSYAHLPSVRGFLLTAGVPLTIGFLVHGGNLYLAMGIMSACFLVFLMIHARMSNSVLVASFRLQEENSALIEDLSDARDTLEQRVLERTSELESMNVALQEEMHAHAETERRLQQAHKMEAVGQLTGGVAHDFNNLLAVIQGNAELLVEERGGNDRQVAAILRASERGAELTQRLLAFSRQQPLRPRSIDLSALVNGMLDLLKRSLGETVEIETFAAKGLWMARADPGQVENALLNLAINARDAMPEGGRLTIECTNARLDEDYVSRNPESAVGDYALLTVADSGVGMAAPVLERAFEPFFTTKDVGEGSGLGLSMVYGFAKQSNGHAALDSELGKGTRVKLYLPRAEPAPKRDKPEISAREPRARDKLILVIEDDAEVRALSVRMLEVLGYRVVAAPETKDARAILRNEKIDLMLSDVVLPGGQSGRSFAEEMKQSYPRLKVVLMSGYPAEMTMMDGHLEPETVLLTKPFQLRELAKTLRQALDR